MSVTSRVYREVKNATNVQQLVATFRANRFAYLLLLPTLIFMLLLLWIPFFRGIWMSFHEWPLGATEPTWIGAGNYIYLFNWGPFYTALKATVIFSLTTVLQLGIALIAALAVTNLGRLKDFLSGIFLLPYTMPPVVTGSIWLFLLKPDFGPVFSYLTQWNILKEPIYWSTNGDAALAVITLVTTWTFWPFMFLIISATLEGIPEEYYESARIYGANYTQQFFRITLPQIKSAILVAVSIRTIWNLAKISQPLQLTQGGPGYQTSILGILLYRFAYSQGALGLSFAVGIILFILVLGFVALFIREFEKESQENLQ